MLFELIAERLYDTDTAEHLAGWENPSNFEATNHYAEDLYETMKGAYFIASRGGLAMKYARPYGAGGTPAGSELIRAVTEDEAREWCKTRGIEVGWLSH